MSRASATRYPLALAALERLVGPRPAEARGAPERVLAPGRLGPSILRPPPDVARPPAPPVRHLEEGAAAGSDGDARTEDLLGELVDMVFVSADDLEGEGRGGGPGDEGRGSGQHEVHLVFKAEVLGGLHLRLQKTSEGMHATFVVEDAAARRAVLDHADGLVRHLRERGFRVVGHEVKLASAGGGP